jgi:hypothetical protein
MSYENGQKLLIEVTVDYVEPALVDGYPTGETIVVVDNHWRIDATTLERLELAGLEHALARVLGASGAIRAGRAAERDSKTLDNVFDDD